MSGAERRGQILDVAREIAAGEGFHAATPRRVADEAGVDRSVIYQQFGTPAGMFVALIDREVARAEAGFDAAVTAAVDAPPGSLLAVAFDGVLKAVHNDEQTWRLFLFPPQGAPPELHSRLESAQSAIVDYLAAELVALAPTMRDPRLAAHVLHAIGRELLQQHILDPETMTAQRVRSFVPNALADLTGLGHRDVSSVGVGSRGSR